MKYESGSYIRIVQCDNATIYIVNGVPLPNPEDADERITKEATSHDGWAPFLQGAISFHGALQETPERDGNKTAWV